MINRHCQSPLLSLALALAIWPGAPASAAAPVTVRYELPAMPLGDALRQIARQSGQNLLVDDRLVEGRTAPSLSGSYTPEAAIASLLAGSGLVSRSVNGTLIITASPSRLADEGESPNMGDQDDVIIVTGTNIRGAPPTSPVILIRRKDIEASGSTSVEQLMRKVPQNSQSGVNQENFLVVGAGADSTEHGAGLNLRGLGQRATLVLVNGRRIAPSGAGSFVDVSLIPLSAIERVEILTDGASAIYGSDAVGGVVNFIMRDDFEGIETLLQAATATRGDGDQLIAGVTGGANWAGGRAMLSYEYRLDDGVKAGDRPFTINLAPETTILPRERRHSLFGLINQEIAPRLDFDLAGSFSHRDTKRTYFLSGIPLPADAVAEAKAASLTGTLSYSFGSDWLVRASAGWSRSATEEMQSQPGGQLLINRFDSRDRILDYGVQADGSLLSLPGGGVRLAFGAQERRESHLDIFETRTTAAREKRATRTVRSLFGELLVPIFSAANRRPGLERLTLTGALRYEHYDRFGGSLDPKVGLLWAPLNGLTLRASYGTSFRAPLLSETVGLYNLFYFPAALLTVAGTAPSGVALATAGTNPDIGPEQSRSWTAGVDLEPAFAPGLKLQTNYYSIRFSERIALPAPTIAVIGNPAFEPIITRMPSLDEVTALIGGAGRVFDLSGPNFTPGGATPGDVTVIVDNRFGNTAVTTTSGLDFLLSYGFEVGRSRFVAELNANYILSFDDRLTAAAPVISALNRAFRPVDLRARGGLSWLRDGWGANLFVNYADDYVDDRRSVTRRVGSFTTVDLGLSYQFGTRNNRRSQPTRIAFNVENLFDEDPPRLLPDPLTTAGLGYDPVNSSGRGRMVSLQLRKVW